MFSVNKEPIGVGRRNQMESQPTLLTRAGFSLILPTLKENEFFHLPSFPDKINVDQVEKKNVEKISPLSPSLLMARIRLQF